VHACALCEPVVLADGDENGLILEALRLDLPTGGDAEADREVELARAQRLDQRPGRLLPDAQAKARVLRLNGVEQGLQAVVRALGEADLQFARGPYAGRPRGREGVLCGLERGAGGLDERAAGVGELDVAGGAHEQFGPEVALEAGDRRAQRLLGHVQPGGGAREVQLLGNGEEVAEQAQIGIHTPRV
jgi:hypothetical protein